MNSTLQTVVASALVAMALGYSAMRFMPKAWRSQVASAAATFVRRLGWTDANARRVEAKLSSGGACGSCDSCKACAAPDPRDGSRTIPIRVG